MVQTRKERERAERHRLILRTARALAEAEGWDAVTTRRIADEIEYSQPVLYSHFAGRTELVAAVAIEGFAELAGALAVVRGAERIVDAYLAFGRQHPALYTAMFMLAVDLPWGTPDAPPALRSTFGHLRDAIRPPSTAAAAAAEDPELDARTELAWAALHGLVTLELAGRLRPDLAERRRATLIALLGGAH